jgi:pyruvate kinase
VKLNPERIERLIGSIDELIERAQTSERNYAESLARVDHRLKSSAVNLVHYRSLRSVDVTGIQTKLGNLGISRLAQSQAHVMASLQAARTLHKALIKREQQNDYKAPVSPKKSSKLLRANTKALLGYRSKGRRVRIMVTMPREAATNYPLLRGLIASGMNTARINCAHDDPDIWFAMIRNLRKASNSLRRNVKVCMDLGGPKIRTGPMIPGPRIISFAPIRDNLGRVIGPGRAWLGPPGRTPASGKHPHLPVSSDWVSRIGAGDTIYFRDSRNKSRSVKVVDEEAGGYWVNGSSRSYVMTGTTLYLNDRNGESTDVLELPATVESIVLKEGDQLVLHASGDLGEPERRDAKGRLVEHPHISCTNHDVFSQVKEGERVLFDDGKIEGIVVTAEPDVRFVIEVKNTKSEGQKLRADKGINFPDSRLTLSGLTGKDRKDLEFVVKYADVVNMSFVNTANDVDELLTELERLDALGKTGVILKVETRSGFENLTEILLAAMKTYPVGVMIARGDLAVECGWEYMPRVQQEIQSICRAGHLPDVWATQVLENMAKTGRPSRAELTDAAAALGAECVMLNKGPHIEDAVHMLDSIFKDLRAYRHDKLPMLPAMPRVWHD